MSTTSLIHTNNDDHHSSSTSTSSSSSSSSSPSPHHHTTQTATVNREINLRDSFRYFLAGNIAGMCGVIVGQPFDTLKVRLQTQSQVHSFSASASSTFHGRNFPAPSYYQPPIFTIGSSFFPNTNPTQFVPNRSGVPSILSLVGTSASHTHAASAAAAVATKPSGPMFNSAFHCLTSTLRSSGIRGLYRGMSSPLLLVGCQKSVAFGVFGTVVQHLQKNEPLPTLMQVCVAGIAGGVANSLILTPVDQFKIAMQIQSYGQTTPVSATSLIVRPQPSMIATARQLIAEQGLIQGVYGNYRATLLREIPMYSIYYTLYSYLNRNYIVDHANKSRWTSSPTSPSDSIPPFGFLTASQKESLTKLFMGGLTGVGCWGSCYPLDTIKSSMVTQTAQNIPRHQRKNIRQMIQHIYRKSVFTRPIGFGVIMIIISLVSCLLLFLVSGGIRPFYHGFTPAMLRAFPVHAVVFFTFASVSEWLEKNHI